MVKNKVVNLPKDTPSAQQRVLHVLGMTQAGDVQYKITPDMKKPYVMSETTFLAVYPEAKDN